MWSTRARLAAAYGGLLFATLAAFCVALYFARRVSANQDLGRHAVRVADQVLQTIVVVERSGKRVTTRDSTLVLTATSEPPAKPTECAAKGACRWVVSVTPLFELRNTLEPRPGYFLVLDKDSRLLYSSFAVRQLPPDDQNDLNRVAIDLVPGGDAAVLALPRDTVLGGRI